MTDVPNGLPIVTTSERSAMRRCPQMWYWRYRMGFTARGETPDALWFGIGVHIALAQWYRPGSRRGRDPAKVFAEWAEGEGDRMIRASRETWDDQPKFEDARELGVDMLTAYVDHYGRDKDWYVIATEHPFRVLVRRAGQPIATFMSTWDGVVRDASDGRVYLLEHKTASQISTAYLALDDQAGAYWALAGNVLRDSGVLKPGEEIAGIIYNFLRKARPDDRPRDEGGAYLNQDGSVSKRQPPLPFVRETIERAPRERSMQVKRLANEIEVMNAMRSGRIPVTKNTTRDCTWCQFFDMCKLHERGGDDWLELARAEFTQRNPYERYTKSAGGAG